MVKKQSDIREKQMKQVYIIGMGPGSRKCLTQQASEAIEHCLRLIVTQIKNYFLLLQPGIFTIL